MISTVDADLFAKKTFTLQKSTNSTTQVKLNTKTSLAEQGQKHSSSVYVQEDKTIQQERLDANQAQDTELLQQGNS